MYNCFKMEIGLFGHQIHIASLRAWSIGLRSLTNAHLVILKNSFLKIYITNSNGRNRINVKFAWNLVGFNYSRGLWIFVLGLITKTLNKRAKLAQDGYQEMRTRREKSEKSHREKISRSPWMSSWFSVANGREIWLNSSSKRNDVKRYFILNSGLLVF